MTLVTRWILLEITKDTHVSDILIEWGDVAPVMEVIGVKRVGRYSLRGMLTKILTVETAARVHRIPQDEILETRNKAIVTVESNETVGR